MTDLVRYLEAETVHSTVHGLEVLMGERMERHLVLYLVHDWALDLAILMAMMMAHHLVGLLGILMDLAKP